MNTMMHNVSVVRILVLISRSARSWGRVSVAVLSMCVFSIPRVFYHCHTSFTTMLIKCYATMTRLKTFFFSMPTLSSVIRKWSLHFKPHWLCPVLCYTESITKELNTMPNNKNNKPYQYTYHKPMQVSMPESLYSVVYSETAFDMLTQHPSHFHTISDAQQFIAQYLSLIHIWRCRRRG